jgi:hypothetical protein
MVNSHGKIEDGEPSTPAMCLGGGLILTGIFLCNKPLARAGKKGI